MVFNYKLLVRLVISSVFITAMPMFAAEGTLEEIVVTAQKREQSLQEVGLTITAFDNQSIKDRALDQAYQLADAIPNLQAFSEAVGQSHFRIRGLGLNEFQVSFDSPVAINVDEVILSKPFMASMGHFDMQRIEVLKGPQGTLFGRNTTGGAVNYYTNKPTDEFEAGFRATYARYNRFDVDGFVSGSLSDNLTGRLSVAGVFTGSDEGPYFNQFNNEKIGVKTDKKQVRAQLQWTNDSTQILGSIQIGSDEGQTLPYDNLFQDIPGGAQAGGITDPAAVISNPIGRFTVNQDYFPTKNHESVSAKLRIDHDFGEMTFTSLTGYESFERDAREDSDNTPVASVNIDWYSDIDQFSQEIRLSGDTGDWNYLVGAYYENDDLLSVNTIDLGAIRAGNDYAQETDTWAIFANSEYAFNEQFSLTLGMRYTEEKNHFTGMSFLAAGLPGPAPKDRIDPGTIIPIPGIVPRDETRTDTDFNFKVGINYFATEDTLLFASYSTGFRSGGFDIGLAADPLIIFDPESVSSFEAGVKSTLLNDTLRANASVFFTKVDDYQENANLPSELVPRRRNIGNLETNGVEVDLTWKPAAAWLIKASAGYTDAEIVKSDFVFGTIPAEGNTPANSPEFSTNMFVSYATPVSDSLELEFSTSWTWVDERFLEVENQPDHLVGSYNTVDATIALSSLDGKWRASIWGRNIFDEIHLTYINDVPGFGLFLPINNEPANYGLTVQFNL